MAPEPGFSVGTPAGDAAYELYGVTGAVRLPSGDIVVLNSGTHELRFYDSTGRHLRSVGGEGEGPGEFGYAASVFLLGRDTLVVWDSRLQRVSLLDCTGTFARAFTFHGTRFLSARLLFDRTLLATRRVPSGSGQQSGVQRGEHQYVIVNLEGDSLATVGSFPDREMYSSTANGFLVVSSRVFGRTTLVATHGTALYVGTNDAYAIDRYERDGRLVRSIRRDIQVPVSDEMFAAQVQAQLEQYTGGMRETLLPVFQEMPKPETLPCYSAIETDPDGNIWVRRFTCASMPTSEWTVFDPQGRMLGDVMFPEGLTVYEIGRDYVVGRWRDEADVEYVRMHELLKP